MERQSYVSGYGGKYQRFASRPVTGARCVQRPARREPLIAAGQVRVPIAASFPIEQIRTAVELQAGRHVHGKIVIDL